MKQLLPPKPQNHWSYPALTRTEGKAPSGESFGAIRLTMALAPPAGVRGTARPSFPVVVPRHPQRRTGYRLAPLPGCTCAKAPLPMAVPFRPERPTCQG